MNGGAMLRTEIIHQLNEAHSDPTFAFPHFSIFYPVDARLSVYRTTRTWALVIETFVFDDAGVGSHDACQTMFFGYGSNLPQAPGIFYPALYVTGDGPSGKLFDPMIDKLISPTAKDMTVRHKVVPITTELTDYAAAGIRSCGTNLRLLVSTWASRRVSLATSCYG
jgi:hypothetical protein